MDILTEHEMRQLSVLTALPLGPPLVIVYIQKHIYSISLLQICQTAFVLKPVMHGDRGIHSTSEWTEKKVGHCDQHAFNSEFNLNLIFILHWSRIKLVKAKIDLKENSSWLMRACDGMRPRAHTSRQTESICLSWRWAEVDGIDLDPSHSFLHSAPPPFLSYFVFSRGCHSQSHTANHLSRRLWSHTQRGKFGFQQRVLDYARAAQNVLANNHPSVSECGLFGRTFRLWILNREWKKNWFEMTGVSYLKSCRCVLGCTYFPMCWWETIERLFKILILEHNTLCPE